MNNEKVKSTSDKDSAEVLQAVYKCGKMGSDSAISLLKYAKTNEMKTDMTSILDGYQKMSSSSSEKLMKMGITPEETDVFAKMGSKIGMTVNTMIDSSNSHLAEMVIQGANMGITDIQSCVNKHKNTSCDKEVIRDAEQGIAFNQQVIEDMKKYL